MGSQTNLRIGVYGTEQGIRRFSPPPPLTSVLNYGSTLVFGSDLPLDEGGVPQGPDPLSGSHGRVSVLPRNKDVRDPVRAHSVDLTSPDSRRGSVGDVLNRLQS